SSVRRGGNRRAAFQPVLLRGGAIPWRARAGAACGRLRGQMRRRRLARKARQESVLGERRHRGGSRRGGPPRRGRQYYTRQFRATGGAKIARAGAGTTRPASENGRTRPTCREHSARIQQIVCN